MGEKPENSLSFEKIIKNLPAEPLLDIPLLRDFFSPPGTIIGRRIDRRYKRLCFVQNELKRINSLKDSSGSNSSFEDFVFANTNFSGYKKIPAADFSFYTEGLEDYENVFFLKNFRIDTSEAEKKIKAAYVKKEEFFCLKKMNPMILSLMRTLDTSLETAPLVREDEITEELNILYYYLKYKKIPQVGSDSAGIVSESIFSHNNISPFFVFLIDHLDGLEYRHSDGNITKLFINAEGSLSGTFMPCGKAWTLLLL